MTGKMIVTAALAAALSLSCANNERSESCPAGTTRSGDTCIEGSPQTGESDSGSTATSDGGKANPGSGGNGGSSEMDSGPGSPALPLYVDDWYGPSGYMGDAAGIKDDDCLAKGPSGVLAHCHRFSWTPGALGWSGVFWQNPDGNWGTEPGLPIPAGATRITFWAWGALGGEKISLGAGYKDSDGFSVTSGELTLTTTPRAYSIDLTGVAYDKVGGGFSWSAAGAASTFFLDGVAWEKSEGTGGNSKVEAGVPPGDSGTPTPDAGPVPAPTLPYAVDRDFITSGAMGDAASGGVLDEEICALPRPGAGRGRCHRITSTPKAAGWAGVFWQYPANNWGTMPGFAMPAGATRIRFYAWGATGTEKVKFAAGMEKPDGFAADTGELALTTSPTEYTIELAGKSYDDVVGAFAWYIGGATAPVAFYLDDLRWE